MIGQVSYPMVSERRGVCGMVHNDEVAGDLA